VGNYKLSENHAQRNTFVLNDCWKGKGIGYCANEVLMCCVHCMFIAQDEQSTLSVITDRENPKPGV
jgi:hypothetical protein